MRPVSIALAVAFCLWSLSLGCEHRGHVETRVERSEAREAPPPRPVEEVYVEPAHPRREVVIQEAPPAEIVEVVPARPSRDVIWVKGHWVHDGHRYVWVKGHFVQERRGYRYIGPRWEHTRHGWEYREERWEGHH